MRTRAVGVCALLVVTAILVGCDGDVQEVTDVGDPAVETAPSGVETWVELASPIAVSGETASATVHVANYSEVETAVAHIWGLKFTSSDGQVAFDTFTWAPPHPRVQSVLRPGESQSRSFEFGIPTPGQYSMVGYFTDDSATEAVDLTIVVSGHPSFDEPVTEPESDVCTRCHAEDSTGPPDPDILSSSMSVFDLWRMEPPGRRSLELARRIVQEGDLVGRDGPAVVDLLGSPDTRAGVVDLPPDAEPRIGYLLTSGGCLEVTFKGGVVIDVSLPPDPN